MSHNAENNIRINVTGTYRHFCGPSGRVFRVVLQNSAGEMYRVSLKHVKTQMAQAIYTD